MLKLAESIRNRYLIPILEEDLVDYSLFLLFAYLKAIKEHIKSNLYKQVFKKSFKISHQSWESNLFRQVIIKLRDSDGKSTF